MHVWRRFLVFMLLLVGLGCLFHLAISSPRFVGACKERLQALVHDQLHSELSIDKLQFTWWPPAVLVDNLQLIEHNSQKPWLTLQHGRLRPYLWPSASGALVIDELELVGLNTSLTTPTTNNHASPDLARHIPLDIWSLQLTQSQIRWQQDEKFVELLDLHANIATHAMTGRRIHLQVGHGVVFLPGILPESQPIPITAEFEATLLGSFDRPQVLIIENANMSTQTLTLQAHGRLPAHATAPIDLKTELNGAWHMPKMSPDVQDPLKAHKQHATKQMLQGQCHVNAHWQGNWHEPTVQFVVEDNQLQFLGNAIGTLKLAGQATKQHVVVESFELGDTTKGFCTGHGKIDLTDHFPVDFKTNLHNASLPHWLEAFDLPDTWVRLHVAGNVELTGTLKPLQWRLMANATTRNLAVLTTSFHQNQAPIMLSIDEATLVGQATLLPDRVLLEKAQISRHNSTVTVRGKLAYDKNEGLDLQVATPHLQLDDLGPIANIAFLGASQIQGQIKGPYHHVAIEAQVQSEQTSIDGYFLGNVQTQLNFEMPVLQLSHILASHQEGKAKGNMRLYFDKPTVYTNAAFVAENLQASDMMNSLGWQQDWLQDLDAPMNGRLVLSGALNLLQGNLQLIAPAVLLHSNHLGQLQVQATFGESIGTALRAKIQLRGKNNLMAHAELLWQRNHTLELQAHMRDIPLEIAAHMSKLSKLEGQLTGDLTLHGPYRELSGNAALQVRDLNINGIQLGNTTWQAIANTGHMQTTGHALDDDITIHGNLTLQDNLAYEVFFTCQDLDLTRLSVLPPSLLVKLSGELQAHGQLTKSDSHTAQAQLQHVEVHWRQLKLQTEQPIELAYQKGLLSLKPSTWQVGHQASITTQGWLKTTGALAFDAGVQADVGILRQLWPTWLLAGRGPLTGQLRVEGKLNAPVIKGYLDVRQASLQLPVGSMLLEDVNAHVVLTEHTLLLQQSQARLGGGLLSLQGEASLVDNTLEQLNFRAKLKHAHIQPMLDMDATFSGDLQLQGPYDNLLLKGKLSLEALHYTARLEFDKLLNKHRSAPFTGLGASSEHPMRLSIKLLAPNNIIVSSNILEAELQADVTLTGTSERLGLLGSITPLWAQAHYHDNLFKIERAYVDFTDEYRIFAEYQLQAKTHACNMMADVTIQGNSDDYHITATGHDEHGNVDSQDVLSCLQLGLRLRDFDGNQRAPAGMSDALAGSLDTLWTVSGLDNKVKKLLPIDIDELRLTSGWSSLSQHNTARVLVGKELGPDLIMRYSRSVMDEANDQAFSLEYRLQQHISLQTNWLSALDVPSGDFGVDLRLHWELR